MVGWKLPITVQQVSISMHMVAGEANEKYVMPNVETQIDWERRYHRSQMMDKHGRHQNGRPDRTPI